MDQMNEGRSFNSIFITMLFNMSWSDCLSVSTVTFCSAFLWPNSVEKAVQRDPTLVCYSLTILV